MRRLLQYVAVVGASGLRTIQLCILIAATASVVGCGAGYGDGVGQTSGAMSNGVETGNRLRNVGSIATRKDANSPWHLWGCSGTLIAPTVYLTAGHCVLLIQQGFYLDEPAPETREWGITFEPKIDPGANPWSPLIPPGVVIHEAAQMKASMTWDDLLGSSYNEDSPYDDVGIIILKKPVRGMPPVALAPVGFLDRFQAQLSQAVFGFAGYGATSFDPWISGTGVPDFGTRRYSPSKLSTTYDKRSFFIATPGNGCMFDSGGPLFLAPSLAANGKAPPFVNFMTHLFTATAPEDDVTLQYCANGSGRFLAMRLDLQSVHDFLDPYLGN